MKTGSYHVSSGIGTHRGGRNDHILTPVLTHRGYRDVWGRQGGGKTPDYRVIELGVNQKPRRKRDTSVSKDLQNVLHSENPAPAAASATNLLFTQL